ncbi:MAG: cytochrome P450 [Nannocystis sp.]|nr:cytochrome P450 [Nannocystis sp.]
MFAALAAHARQRLLDNPIANIVAMGRDPYGLLERLYRRDGDMFRLRIAGMETVYVCVDPEGVRQLVAGSYEQFERFAGGVELFLGPQSLIRMDDDPHRKRRKMMNPAFSAESVRAFGPTMHDLTLRVLGGLKPGASLALLDPMQEITLRVIMRCVFGVAEGPRLEELRQLVIGYLRQIFGPEALALAAARTPAGAQRWFHDHSTAAAMTRPDATFVPSRWPLWRIADRLGRIHALLDAEIDRCVAEGPETRSDVLATLLQARFDDGAGMGRDELKEQLLLLLLGGYETTSISLCWAMHCLMHNPATLARVRAELKTVMGAGPIDATRVRELTYLGAAINESMRLYPIATGVSRRLKVPMTLGGREVKPGEIVLACIYLTHRDPAIWKDPETFEPERMLERRPPPWQMFPFGSGVWRCLGAAFAEHEMRIVLAELCARFDLEAEGPPVRAVQRGITVGPSGGMRVRVTGVRD